MTEAIRNAMGEAMSEAMWEYIRQVMRGAMWEGTNKEAMQSDVSTKKGPVRIMREAPGEAIGKPRRKPSEKTQGKPFRQSCEKPYEGSHVGNHDGSHVSNHLGSHNRGHNRHYEKKTTVTEATWEAICIRSWEAMCETTKHNNYVDKGMSECIIKAIYSTEETSLKTRQLNAITRMRNYD